MDLLKWIFAPMELFIWHPERIGAVALVLFVLYLVLPSLRRPRTRPLLIALVTWGLYAPWEWYCKVKGYDIRVDLLLICPFLLVVAVWGLAASVKKR